METVTQTFSGTADADKTVVATVSRNGDLVGRMYVTSTLATTTDGASLVNSAEVEIGGQKIDKHTAEWMQIANELSTPDSKAAALKTMQGCVSVHDGTANVNAVSTVQVPLQFWFNRNPGLALPLIALQYHEVKVKVTLGNAAAGGDTSCALNADYIYLDTDERRRFAQVSHEYLIEQVQEESAKGSSNTSTLNFNHPVKELIWTNAVGSDYTNAKLVLNGHDRMAAQPAEYYQLRQPMDHHTAVPGQNVPQLNNPQLDGLPVCIVQDQAASANGNDLAATILTTSAANTLTLVVGSNFVGTIVGQTVIKVGDILSVVTDVNADTAGEVELSHVQVTKVTANTNSLTVICKLDTPGVSNRTPTASTASTSLLTVSRIARAAGGCRTSQMTKKINCYSFALKPEEHQPSGTCNFSRIDNAQLVTTGTSLAATDKIYAVNYNVLRVMSGMGGLAYSN
tara:strand:- start:86 stop:1450 length:1365 start_codon:yes stop_codon:yes gene_type:complete